MSPALRMWFGAGLAALAALTTVIVLICDAFDKRPRDQRGQVPGDRLVLRDQLICLRYKPQSHIDVDAIIAEHKRGTQ
jgi:hypothetical protein